VAKHGLDFADAPKVFDGPMVLFEDDRSRPAEYLVVLIVHVESDATIRIISMRKADSNQTDIRDFSRVHTLKVLP